MSTRSSGAISERTIDALCGSISAQIDAASAGCISRSNDARSVGRDARRLPLRACGGGALSTVDGIGGVRGLQVGSRLFWVSADKFASAVRLSAG